MSKLRLFLYAGAAVIYGSAIALAVPTKEDHPDVPSKSDLSAPGPAPSLTEAVQPTERNADAFVEGAVLPPPGPAPTE